MIPLSLRQVTADPVQRPSFVKHLGLTAPARPSQPGLFDQDV